MRFNKRIFFSQLRKWHKYLALLIGVQVLFWTASGLFMSFVPIDDVRGSHLVKEKGSDPIILSVDSFDIIKKAVSKLNGAGNGVQEIKIRRILDREIFDVSTTNGKKIIFDAHNGIQLNPIDSEMAKGIAESRYKGKGSVSSVELIQSPIIEYRGTYPVWRVEFLDGSQSFYVDPETAALKAVRTDLWRVYDFLWMLHIMDYSERENFNNWWLVIAAFLGVMLTITGIFLIPMSFRWISLR